MTTLQYSFGMCLPNRLPDERYRRSCTI